MSKTDMPEVFAAVRASSSDRSHRVHTVPNGERTPKYMGRLLEALEGATPEEALVSFLREQHRMWRSVAVLARRPKAVRQATRCASAFDAWASSASSLCPARLLPSEPSALDVLHWISVHPGAHEALPIVQEAIRVLSGQTGRKQDQ